MHLFILLVQYTRNYGCNLYNNIYNENACSIRTATLHSLNVDLQKVGHPRRYVDIISYYVYYHILYYDVEYYDNQMTGRLYNVVV